MAKKFRTLPVEYKRQLSLGLTPLFVKSAKSRDFEDRLVVVVDWGQDEEGEYLVGWKVTMTPTGMDHPAFKKQLPYEDESVLKMNKRGVARNGSEPTATIWPDSMWLRIGSVTEIPSTLRRDYFAAHTFGNDRPKRSWSPKPRKGKRRQKGMTTDLATLIEELILKAPASVALVDFVERKDDKLFIKADDGFVYQVHVSK